MPVTSKDNESSYNPDSKPLSTINNQLTNLSSNYPDNQIQNDQYYIICEFMTDELEDMFNPYYVSYAEYQIKEQYVGLYLKSEQGELYNIQNFIWFIQQVLGTIQYATNILNENPALYYDIQPIKNKYQELLESKKSIIHLFISLNNNNSNNTIDS